MLKCGADKQNAVPLFVSFLIGLVVFGGPSILFAECDGLACTQVCSNNSSYCSGISCSSEKNGACECEIKKKIVGGGTLSICRTYGSCDLGCDGADDFPTKSSVASVYQDFNFLGLRAAIAAEKHDALTARKHDFDYELVAWVLESSRGRQGFEVGRTRFDVTIARSLPDHYLEDGSAAFQPAQSVSVLLDVEDDRMSVELTFSEGIEVFGEILDGGAAGVLRIMEAGQSNPIVLSW